MKKLLIFVFALICYKAAAQEYRPMKEFGTDTIRYLQYNFVDRQDQYIGRPLSKVLEDYEFRIAELLRIETYPYAPGANGKSWIYAASIKYQKYGPTYKVPFANVTVYFKPPHLPSEPLQSLKIANVNGWREVLKNCIVEKIDLAIGPFGPKSRPQTKTLEPERGIENRKDSVFIPFTVTM